MHPMDDAHACTLLNKVAVDTALLCQFGSNKQGQCQIFMGAAVLQGLHIDFRMTRSRLCLEASHKVAGVSMMKPTTWK